MSKPSKITASELVLSAIIFLQQNNGVSAKDITKFICEKRGCKQSHVRSEVKRALERATENGIFSKKKGLYRIESGLGSNNKISIKVRTGAKNRRMKRIKRSNSVRGTEDQTGEPLAKMYKGGSALPTMCDTPFVKTYSLANDNNTYTLDLSDKPSRTLSNGRRISIHRLQAPIDSEDEDFLDDEDEDDDDVDYFSDEQTSRRRSCSHEKREMMKKKSPSPSPSPSPPPPPPPPPLKRKAQPRKHRNKMKGGNKKRKLSKSKKKPNRRGRPNKRCAKKPGEEIDRGVEGEINENNTPEENEQKMEVVVGGVEGERQQEAREEDDIGKGEEMMDAENISLDVSENEEEEEDEECDYTEYSGEYDDVGDIENDNLEVDMDEERTEDEEEEEQDDSKTLDEVTKTIKQEVLTAKASNLHSKNTADDSTVTAAQQQQEATKEEQKFKRYRSPSLLRSFKKTTDSKTGCTVEVKKVHSRK